MQEHASTLARRSAWRASLMLAVVVLVASTVTATARAATRHESSGDHGRHRASLSIVAAGLDNPRGLEVGPDGSLYVAEAGLGGTGSTAGQCPQVVPPIGPYTGSSTGSRIVRIDMDGTRTTVAEGLPSSQTSAASGGFVSGVADVAFLDGQLYAVLAGAGCSHGVADVPNSVVRIDADGSYHVVADLSAFFLANPVAQPEAEDFEPDGTPYSMIASHGALFVVEANQGQLLKVNPSTGSIDRVADISATQGHFVPTAVLRRHGAFLVGNLGVFPVQPGTQKILRVEADGDVDVFAEGFTTILGLAKGRHGSVYVLEASTVAGFPTPGTGRLVRLDHHGDTTVVVDHLTMPTGLTAGPDGALYISNYGFGFSPGAGQILRVDVR
jgi:hypothetical protein